MVLFVGDSGSVERQVMFPGNGPINALIEKSLEVFEADPWTDQDYNEIKKQFEEVYSIEETWKRLGRKS